MAQAVRSIDEKRKIVRYAVWVSMWKCQIIESECSVINIDVVSWKFYSRTFIVGHLQDFQLETNRGFNKYTSTW